jgi:hypothetical protein
MSAPLDRDRLLKALTMAARATNDKEAVAGLRGAYRLLDAAGKSLDDVLVMPGVPTQVRGDEDATVMLEYCVAHSHLLSAKEHGFIFGVRSRGRWLTEKQLKWLRDIARSLPERGERAA